MRKFVFGLAGGIALLTAVVLYFQMVHAYQVRVSEHFVSSSQIPAPFNGARLIQLSDLNIETARDVRVLERVVEEVNELAPDMIALTGNVFGTGSVSAQIMNDTAYLLGNLQADIGKVAVLGGTDLEREDEVMALLDSVDFHVLRNEYRQFFNGTVAGITFLGMDPASRGNHPNHLMAQVNLEDTFQILLTHEGQFAASVVEHNIGLKLAGYCLGQSAPTVQCSQFSEGAYRFADQLVNISAGVGSGNGIFGFLKRPSMDSFLLMRQ